MALQDYNLLKAMNQSMLMDLVPKGFDFITEPWLHQLASFVANIANDQFMLALDLGTGKSKISIDTFRYHFYNLGRQKILVVCLNVAVENWVNEVTIHSNEFSSIAIKKQNKKEKTELILGNDYDIKVISFEAFRALFTKRVPSDKKEGKKMEVLDMDAVYKFQRAGYTGIVIDESHKIKNHESLIFRLMDLTSQNIHNRYNLTGTPFHKLLDIWTQYFLLDRGRTFGNNFFLFRKKYFENKKVFVRRLGYEVDNWVVTAAGKAEIMRRMYSIAIRYDESEVKGMPKKNFTKIRYALSPAQRKEYTFVKENESAEKTHGKNRSMVYRQICSGFVLRIDKVFPENPKLKAAMELVEQVVEAGEKIVIFHVFDMEYQLFAKALKIKKIGFAAINGGTKDHWKEQQDFTYDEKKSVVVVNSKSGAASINLQVARYCLFYSNDPSIIIRKQAIKRIHRGNIKRPRFYYDMIGIGTVEQYMYTQLSKGVDVFDEVMSADEWRKAIEGE